MANVAGHAETLVRASAQLGGCPGQGVPSCIGQVDLEKVAEMIELIGISSFAERLVDALHVIERQSVWPAMLGARDAQCLLLDGARAVRHCAPRRSGRLIAHATCEKLARTQRLEAIYGLPLGILSSHVIRKPISYVR